MGVGNDTKVTIRENENMTVDYFNQSGCKYAVSVEEGNRYLQHAYTLGDADLKKLPDDTLHHIHGYRLTDDEIFTHIFTEGGTLSPSEWLSIYADRKKMSIIRAISKRVAEFQPIGEILNCKQLAIYALSFMRRHNLTPELEESDKHEYKMPELLEILAMCGTLPRFKIFVDKTKMLSKQLNKTPFSHILTDIIREVDWIRYMDDGRYAYNLFESLKYVLEQANLSNEDKVGTFWSFLRMCDFRTNFDQDKIKIFKLFDDQSLNFNITIDIRHNLGYSPGRMKDKIETYRYHAHPVHSEKELTDKEIEDRSDMKWVVGAFSSYQGEVYVTKLSEAILIDNATNVTRFQLVPYDYFRRKMTSLRYPNECLSNKGDPALWINTNCLQKKSPTQR
jgi:hypothetical protein